MSARITTVVVVEMLTSLGFPDTILSWFSSYFWTLPNFPDDFLILYYTLKCWDAKHSILSPVSLHPPWVVFIHLSFKRHWLPCPWLPAAPSRSDPAELWTPFLESCLGVSRTTGKATWPKLHSPPFWAQFIHSFNWYLLSTRRTGPVSSPAAELIAMHSHSHRPRSGLHQLLLLKLNFFLVIAKSMKKKKIKPACNSNSRNNLEMNFLPFFAYTFYIIESILYVQFWKPLIYHKHFPILLKILQNIILNG